MRTKALLMLSTLFLAGSTLAACGDDATGDSGPLIPGIGNNGAGGDGDGDAPGNNGGGGNGGESPGGNNGNNGGDGDGDGDGNPNFPPPGELPAGEPYPNDWTWVEVADSTCRDGSPAGYYYRKGTENNLLIYLNGGGACADSFFCNLNPKNVNYDFPIEQLLHGAGELFLGIDALEALGYRQRQQAPEEGIFKRAEPANPVGKWSMIYIPYCTGDIHAGSRRDVMIEGLAGPQQFTGRLNYQKFLDSFGPAFVNVDKVLMTGSSAGGFGTLINADYTQDWFKQRGNAKLFAISDSGVPFRDEYMSACLQKRWRDTWGLNDALPEHCRTDAGGIAECVGNYLFHDKYKGRMLGGFVSGTEDEIIRAFFAPGENNCTVDPAANTVETSITGVGAYPGPKFHEGLKDVITHVAKRGTVGYYAIATPGKSGKHMHLWRPHFYEKNDNELSIAEWVAKILNGEPNEQGALF